MGQAPCDLLASSFALGSAAMRSPTVVQHSITFGGRKTSVTLEDAFWEALKEIAYSRRMTISDWSARSTHSAGITTYRRRLGCSFWSSIGAKFQTLADREGVPG